MAKNRIVKIIHYNKYKEFYITVNFKSIRRNDLKRMLNDLKKQKINIISITYSGNLSKFRLISELINSYPTIAIGNSISGKNMTPNGICIFGIQGKGVKVGYIKRKHKTIGSHFFLPTKNEGLFFAIPGNLRRQQSEDFKKETSGVYDVIEKILADYGFSARNIYRFWIYMEKISNNYAELNKVRDKFFKKNKIFDFPASTGIEAKLPGGQNINISFEALKLRKDEIENSTLKSGLQCEACEYGPKFSRGKVLKFKNDNVRKIYISGTSSVDQKGESILMEDYKKNVEYVVTCVEHLLKKKGMSLGDIVMARAYSKNCNIQEVFEKLYLSRKWNFPYNALLTNVCRDNFLFELECIAAAKIL